MANNNDDLLEPDFDAPIEGYPPTEWDEVAPMGYQETGASQLSDDSYLIDDDYTPGWEQAMQEQEEPVRQLTAEEAGTDFTQEEPVQEFTAEEMGTDFTQDEPVRELTAEEAGTDFTAPQPAGANIGERLLEPDFGGVEALEQAQQTQPEVDAVTGADGGPMPQEPQAPPPPPGSQEDLISRPVTPTDIRKVGLEGIRRQHEAEQLYAEQYGKAVEDARIQEAEAMQAQQSADYMAGMELKRLTDEHAQLMQEDPKSWWEGANTTQKIGAVVSAIFGGMLAGLNGGPNTGLEAILKIADDDMNRQMARLSNRRANLGEQRTLVQERLANSNNQFRTKQAYLLATLGKVKEELMSEMITLDPNGSLMQKYQEYLVQIAQQEAAIQRQVGAEAWERGHKQAQQAIEIKKAELESSDKAKQRALEYRGQNITQRGQDLAFIKDRFSVSDQIAKETTMEERKNLVANGWSGGYAVDKAGNRHWIYLTPGDESKKAVRDVTEGRNLLIRNLQNLDALMKAEGYEFWDQAQGEERARATAVMGKLLGQRQQTQQELELAEKSLGKPKGWFLGELRKDPGAMERLAKFADLAVMEKVRQNVQIGRGYENMTVELDSRKLVPDAIKGSGPPPPLPLGAGGIKLDTVNEFGTVSNREIPWWAADSDKQRLSSLLLISKNYDATKGMGKPHLERGLFDKSNLVRGAAAVSLGKHGDPDSVPYLDQVATTDTDTNVRRFAQQAADKIRANPAFAGAFEKKAQELNITPPPNPFEGEGASAGGSYSGPTLSPEQAVEIMNQNRVR